MNDRFILQTLAILTGFVIDWFIGDPYSLPHPIRLIGKLIYTRMDSLGYFDEIKKELNLTETTKQIIKEDPPYFEAIIQNVLK